MTKTDEAETGSPPMPPDDVSPPAESPPQDKWRCLDCGEEFKIKKYARPISCANPNCKNKKHFEALSGPFKYFQGERFIPMRLAEEIKQRHRFLTHIKSHIIFVFNNGTYHRHGEEIIREEARRALGPEATETRINETVRHIEETTYAPPEVFNAPLELVCVKNGILNIFTGELKPHTPDIVFLSQIPVEYVPEADCPKIKQFLSEVCHPEDIPVIQEWLGYCLLRDYRFAKILMLVGSGANGKSTFLRLVAKFLGEENVAGPALQDLIYNRFTREELFGKLANIHADIPATRLAHTGIIKMLTGQDLIFADVKMKKPFEFYNYAKLMYSANELPQTDDTTDAFWRRWIIIEFPNKFPEGAPGTNEKILEELTTPQELSGLLNFALEGLRRLLDQHGFSMTKTREEIEHEWVARSDSLRAFVMDYVREDSDAWVFKDDFYQAYQEFCAEHNLVALEKNMVGRRLPALLRTSEFKPLDPEIGKQGRAWKGIRLIGPFANKTHITDRTKKLTEFASRLASLQDSMTNMTKNSITYYTLEGLSPSQSVTINKKNRDMCSTVLQPHDEITVIALMDLTDPPVLLSPQSEPYKVPPTPLGGKCRIPVWAASVLAGKGLVRIEKEEGDHGDDGHEP